MSQAAAFASTGALNRFLATGSGHRVPVLDASAVFWAEAANSAAAAIFAGLFALGYYHEKSHRPAETPAEGDANG